MLHQFISTILFPELTISSKPLFQKERPKSVKAGPVFNMAVSHPTQILRRQLPWIPNAIQPRQNTVGLLLGLRT